MTHSMTHSVTRSTPTPIVRTLAPAEAAAAIPALADVLLDCVAGGASVSFMAPMDRAEAVAFWEKVAAAVARGDRRLLVAVDADGTLLGTVQLILDHPPNQPHRADVAKLLVARAGRRRGLGEALMRAVEREAIAAAKSLLVLDTTHGGDAERLYDRLGWTRLGIMPNHAMMPDGVWSDTTFFYRHLAPPPAWSPTG